jgi:very-short-patch-repair endonuclease
MDIKTHFFKDGIFVKQSVRAKKFDDFFNQLKKIYNTDNKSELLWLMDNVRPVCRECGANTKFLNYRLGYRELCSDKCARTNKLTKERRVNSIKGFFDTHFKVSNSMHLDSTKIAMSQTNQERYGTDWYVETDSFKSSYAKTSLDNWGVPNPQSSPKLKEQIKESILKKYGRTTARSFEENRKNRITDVTEWCEEMNIKHTEFDASVVLGEHQFNFSHSCGTKWSQQIGTLLPVCPMCHRGSKVEQNLKEWISSLKLSNIKFNDRNAIKPLELDIYLPEQKVAIEMNGLYWHHDDSGRTSVKDKTDMCLKNGIQLISIWENEWNDDFSREKIKGVILAKLGVAEKIYARKTTIKELSLNESRNFLNTNHLQGWASASETFGLMFNNEIVMLISVGVRRWNGSIADKEIIRLCTKNGMQIVGGFSKLLAKFKGQRLLSYCDRRFGTGRGYEAVGFELIGITKPNYQWWKGNKFLKRGSTARKRLPKLLGETFFEQLSENDNMKNAGWKKLSDAGNLKYILLPD